MAFHVGINMSSLRADHLYRFCHQNLELRLAPVGIIFECQVVRFIENLRDIHW